MKCLKLLFLKVKVYLKFEFLVRVMLNLIGLLMLVGDVLIVSLLIVIIGL